MQKLITYIQKQDWQSLLKEINKLSTQESQEAFRFFSKLDVEKDLMFIKRKKMYSRKFYDEMFEMQSMLDYAVLLSNRNENSFRKDARVRDALRSLLGSKLHTLDVNAMLMFYEVYPPTDIEAFIVAQGKDDFFNFNFQLLWAIYKRGFVSFNEEFFVNELFVFTQFDKRDIQEEVDFLVENPEVLEKVFKYFYKYNMPLLDTTKWRGVDESFCARTVNYWADVMKLLEQRGIEMPRELVSNLLGTLLYNWKKPHINWHISILKFLKPSKEEYLKEQEFLVMALNSENNTVLNFALGALKSIYKMKGFDGDLFLQNVESIYVKEKFDKGIVNTLKIVEYFLNIEKNFSLKYAQNLSLGLIQTDTNTQVLFADMLLKYLPKKKLVETVEPYFSCLKPKSKELLNLQDVSGESCLPEVLVEEKVKIDIPKNWTDLLYHVGICMGSNSFIDMEIFFDALLELQDEIPNDFEKQLKPFTKKLFKDNGDGMAMVHFSDFFINWTGKNKNYAVKLKWEYNSLPFVKQKAMLTYARLQKNIKLPSLSTPTHYPFWVDPDVLVKKLLRYEEEGLEVDLDDLKMATNRILKENITPKCIEKVKTLKGDYKDTLLSEFNSYKEGNFSNLIKPFYLDFSIKQDKYWTRMILSHNDLGYDRAYRTEIDAQLTTRPHYVDPLLCLYILDTTSGNEVQEMEYCQYPLQFILEHQILVHHGGWLYVAQCLVFQTQIARDLAREYLLFSLANKSLNEAYFVEVLSRMMVESYAPIPRLLESFNEAERPLDLKKLHFTIAKACMEKVEKVSKKPRSFKKIIEHYDELKKELNLT